MSQPIDPLDPNSLPIDPREAAILLLGMTAGELKSIDEKVVSGRNSVGGIRSDLNKIVSDIRNIKVDNIQPQPTVPQNVQVVEQPQVQQVTVQNSPNLPAIEPQATPQLIQDDSNQLEFDFYKKLKPEDIEYQLRLIKSSLDNLETKVNIIIDLFKKKAPKINGTVNQ